MQLETYLLFCFRLNISVTPTRDKRKRNVDRDGPRTKRQKKVDSTSSSSAGSIQICDVDPDGRYVQIKNMSDKVVIVYCCCCCLQLLFIRWNPLVDSRLCMRLKRQVTSRSLSSTTNLNSRGEPVSQYV